MKYTLDEVTEKLERACRRIDELQGKNLRLSERNSALLEESIKAQEILTSQSVANEERDDLERRLQNAELLIERMKDELSRAKGKEECLYQDFKKGNALYLAENLRVEKLRMALWEIRHIIWKNARMRWYSVGFWKLLVPIFSIAHNALQPSEKSSEITMDKKPGAEVTE